MSNARSTTAASRPTVQAVLEMAARVAHSMASTQPCKLEKSDDLPKAVRLAWEMVRPKLGNNPQAQELDRLIANVLGGRGAS